MRLRAYRQLALGGYRKYSSYTTAAIAGLFTNVAFGLLRVAVMKGVYQHTSDIGGYGLQQAITYVWLVQGFMMIVQMFGWTDIAQRISDGTITTDLLRPVDVQTSYLAADLGRAAYYALYRGIPPVVAGALIFGLAYPADIVGWLAFVLSLVLAVTVSFFFRFIYNICAFWLLDYRGVTLVAVVLTNLLSGFIIPVSFFPHWLVILAKLTPFPAMVQIPIDIFTGATTGTSDIVGIFQQAAWVLILLVIGRLGFRTGRYKLVVQGG
jgi:viologen exporter family transport system permease protein